MRALGVNIYWKVKVKDVREEVYGGEVPTKDDVGLLILRLLRQRRLNYIRADYFQKKISYKVHYFEKCWMNHT